MSQLHESHPVVNGLIPQVPDNDPQETAEWVESLSGLINEKGGPRARYILLHMLSEARRNGVQLPQEYTTPYVNTIPVDQEPYFPGDEAMEREYRRWIRWNAAVQVTRAQRPGVKVGGHISSYASVATLYEVGLNHFFRGKDHPGGGDHVFFQGHASPGPYARAFLEGRLSEEQMDGFRQQVSTEHGLPSYPHPRQLEEFWEYPTVSLGLGPAEAIYQAWFDRYLHMNGIKDTSQQHTWAFIGDGEMDEPESRGMLQLAAQQRLDNLTFVINCNLQRLDGPVRGNGKIIQELEAFFRGAGWNVIKVIWGENWDPLLAADAEGALVAIMNATNDGDYQTMKANDGAWVREHFFGQDPRTAAMVAEWSDDEIWSLRRGGHDYKKIYNAYKAATEFNGGPTVILVHTIKGYFLGTHFAGRNATHQMKKLALDDLKGLRDRCGIPISDAQLEADPYQPPYYKEPDDSDAMAYMFEHRRALGGFLPERRTTGKELQLPGEKAYRSIKKGSGHQKIASTMAFVRILKDLMREKSFGPFVVPILPDEARTFGMDSFFPTNKIYNPNGQNYTPVDHDLMLSYREAVNGQLLHTGINEAGSVAAWTAAATSYATHGQPMVPIYLFYSMFGYQRTGDAMWAAADQMGRGFYIAATAGRTTLTGEGTQHMDGHSPILVSTNTALVSYDPCYGYELAHIVEDGLRRMYGDEPEDIAYYITAYNEPMEQPAEPADVDVEGIIRGIHKIADAPESDGPEVQLLASGVGVPWVLDARRILVRDWGVRASVWSVTSWGELRREALAVDKENFLHPSAPRRVPYLTGRLAGAKGPFVATSDYDHAVPDLIRPWVPGSYHVLGADGFGFSDTRAAARRHYLIDAHSVVVKALQALADDGGLSREVLQHAVDRYDLSNVSAGRSGAQGGEA